MRNASVVLALAVLPLQACGSGESTSTSRTGTSSDPAGFNPPPPLEGYTRLTAKTIPDIQPGDDVTFCQYMMAPFDHDVDVLDVRGYQSKFGHHAVAFSYQPTGDIALGDSIECMGSEVSSGAGTMAGDMTTQSGSMGTFLGAVGGDSSNAEGSSAVLPEGVAFRLNTGNGVLLNIHYINTGEEPINGDAVLDLKFAETDPNRKIAAMFININTDFTLAPGAATDSSIACVAGSDLSLLMMSNHMHEYGTSASTTLTRGDTGAVEMMHDDPAWTYDMQFNPQYTKWTVDTPLVIHAGDTIRTSCSWDNSTSESLVFPREMCIGVGFALATGDNPVAPVCYKGTWYDLRTMTPTATATPTP